MGYLQQIGLSSHGTEAARVFEAIFPSIGELGCSSPALFMESSWNNYLKHQGNSNRNLNGSIFEYLIALVLLYHNRLPLYYQAQLEFIPNVYYDLLLYSQEIGPISISAKTSLRERYKQADLEALVLKNVHRKAKCILLTLDEKEGAQIQKKVQSGALVGIDQAIIVTSAEFDDFVNSLGSYKLIEAPLVKAVRAQREITLNPFKHPLTLL